MVMESDGPMSLILANLNFGWMESWPNKGIENDVQKPAPLMPGVRFHLDTDEKLHFVLDFRRNDDTKNK
jgi:hypothetical protein